MDVALYVVKKQFALGYLDKIAGPSRSAAKHIDHVKHGLALLRKVNVTLKLMM